MPTALCLRVSVEANSAPDGIELDKFRQYRHALNMEFKFLLHVVDPITEQEHVFPEWMELVKNPDTELFVPAIDEEHRAVSVTSLYTFMLQPDANIIAKPNTSLIEQTGYDVTVDELQTAKLDTVEARQSRRNYYLRWATLGSKPPEAAWFYVEQKQLMSVSSAKQFLLDNGGVYLTGKNLATPLPVAVLPVSPTIGT